ncbi:MAG: RNA pseudouridine synthase [Spirochaetaceae bacterium]|jgi:23S rRNA pseudouridine1911/1915/1917 synthase|nr:RNA pseudouridine synthase [Spirochaetaceae bacterium]
MSPLPLPEIEEQPRITAETPSYIVVDKPHNRHTAPLHAGEGGTLLEWCAQTFPEVLAIGGRKALEGGLLHRLDYETAGLVLVARTQSAYDFLAAEQEAGRFEKEYTAVTRPMPEGACTVWNTEICPASLISGVPIIPGMIGIIESSFRHYGPGRKCVKPEPCGSGRLQTERRYVTRIVDREEHGELVVFRVQLTQGFHHQIRAHLAWVGYPINNDTRYGGANTGGPLELIADRLLFTDPETGSTRVCVKRRGV